MSVFTFGGFPVDMASDELTTPGLSTFFPKFASIGVDDADIRSASSTEIVAQDPTLPYHSKLIIRGFFDASTDATLLASRVTSIRAETDAGALIFEAIGFSVSLAQAFELDLDQLVDLIVGGSDTILGSPFDDRLLGYGGNDVIDGRAGADTMEGGAGNDTFFVDAPGDEVVELAGQGVDTVRTLVSYALGVNVENLALIATDPIVGTAIGGTGNALDNFLSGSENPGANVLAGGPGNDTYETGPGDTIVELPGEGVDALRTGAASVILPDHVETLVLLNPNGSATGNDAPNTMTGSSGANTLDGGRGPDTLAGLGGGDTYHIDSSADTVTEAAGAGTDTIVSKVVIVLPANVENAAAAPGRSVVALIGNAAANELTGNDGANLLAGASGNDLLDGGRGADVLLGGDGNDVLIGGAGLDVLLGGTGADRFRFDAAPDGGNVDRIMDLLPGVDDIELSVAAFAGLSAAGGALAAGVFVKGVAPVALDADDRLLYDTATGRLYYDADANGAASPELIAALQGAPNLAATDLALVG